MTAVNQIIDFWTTTFLNAYNTYKANGGIWFYCTIAIVVVFPLLRRMVRAIRGGR